MRHNSKVTKNLTGRFIVQTEKKLVQPGQENGKLKYMCLVLKHDNLFLNASVSN